MWAFATTGRPSSVRPSLTFCILIFSSETTGPIGTKLGKIGGAWVVPFQNCIRWSRSQPRWPPLLKIENSTKKKSFKIFSSETNLANWDQTLVEWSLCGPLSESYPMTPPANQDIFLPFDTTWIIFKYILHELCFWFVTEYCKNKYLHLLQLVQHLYMLFAVWFLPCWILHCDLWTCGLAGWFILKYIIRNRKAKCFGWFYVHIY